nr:DUF4870 domain-containing protein [Auraticoccus cholistanensis]
MTCVPVLSNVLATVAAVLVHRSTDRRAGFAREVTRRAANLQLTLALATVLLLGVHVLLLFLLTRGEPQSGFFPIGIAISLVPVLGLYACVLSVVSAVRAGRGRLTPAVGAIGFFRR